MKHFISVMLFSVLSSHLAFGSKIVVTGSSTIAPLATELAKAFEKQKKDIRIDVQSGGSSRGIQDARSGLANIGMVSRSLKTDESDLKKTKIALDGIAMIIHSANKLKTLSEENIVKIYKGEITNWKEVGGDDLKITVVNKAEGRSTLELFMQYFGLKNSEIKAQVIIGDNEQGIKTVSTNKGAIGYVSIGAAEVNEKNGVKIRLLDLKGVKAIVENIKNGTYPIVRELNFVTKDTPAGEVKEFLDWATHSAAARSLIVENFFVPLDK